MITPYYPRLRSLKNVIALATICFLISIFSLTSAKNNRSLATNASILSNTNSGSICKGDSILLFVKSTTPSDSVFIQSLVSGDTIAKGLDYVSVYIKSHQVGAYRVSASDLLSFESKDITFTTPIAQISGLDSIVACFYTDTLKLNASNSTGGTLFPTPPYKYTWSTNDANLKLTNATTNNIVITQNTKIRPATSTLILEIEDASGCNSKDSSVLVWDRDVDLKLSNYLLIFCPGSSSSSKAYINGPGKLNNYQWKIITGPANFTVASDTFITVTGGVNALIEVSAKNKYNCRFADTLIAIKTNLLTKITLSDTLVCKDEFVNMTVSFDSIPNATYLYKWKVNGTLVSTSKKPSIQIKENSTIELTVRDQALACDYITTTQVNISTPIAVAGSLLKDTFRICENIFDTSLNGLASYSGTPLNNVSPYLYQWSSSDANFELSNTNTNTVGIKNLNESDNYKGLIQLQITDKLGCTDIDTAWLEWNNQFRLHFDKDSILFCEGKKDSINVSDNNLGTFSNYTWNLVSGTADFSNIDSKLIVTSANNAKISVFARDEYNCLSNRDTIFFDDINVNPKINSLNPAYCNEEVINLGLTFDSIPGHNYSFLWTRNGLNYSTKKDTTYEFLDNSNFKLYLQDLTLSCIDSSSTSINLSVPATIAGLSDTVSVCNDVFTLEINSSSSNGTPFTASTPYLYAWSSNEVNLNLRQTSTDKVSIENTGKLNNFTGGIELKITDSIGCTATDSVWVKWDKQKDVVFSASDLLFCQAKTDSVKATLVGTGDFVSYNWNLLSGTATYSIKDDSTIVFSAANAAYLEVIATDANACIFKDTLSVSDADVNASIAILKNLVCTDDLVSLSAVYDSISGHNYSAQWLVDNVIYSTSKDTVLKATSNSTIKLYVSDLTLSCIDSSSTSINLSVPSTLTGLSDTVSVCNDVFTLEINSSSSNGTPFTTSAPYIYTWSSNEVNLNLTQTTTDKVSIENTGMLNNFTGGIELKITDSIGCTASDSVWVKWDKQKDVVLSSTDLLFCKAKTDSVKATLVGTGNFVSYNWNSLSGTATYSIKDDSTIVFSAANAASLEIIATDANACIFKDTLSVSDVDVNASIDILKNLVCTDDLVSLSAVYDSISGHNYSAQWLVDNVIYSTRKDTVLKATSNSTIKLYVQDVTLSCIDSSSTSINLSVPATIAGLSDTVSVCNDVFTLEFNSSSSNGTPFTTSAPYIYSWSSNEVNLNLTQTSTDKVSIENTGKLNNFTGGIELKITDSIGCTASDSVWVKWDKQKDVVLSSTDLLFCQAKTDSVKATLVGTGDFVTYDWNLLSGTATYSIKDDSTIVFSAANAASVEVVATDANACIFKDTLSVSDVDVNASIDILKNLVCTDDLVSLSAVYDSISGHNYSAQWLVDNVIYSTSKDTVLKATSNSTIKLYVSDLTLSCIDSSSTSINLSVPSTLAGLSDTVSVCNDVFTLEINSSSSNGTPFTASAPYLYAWSSNDANLNLTQTTTDKVSIENTGMLNNFTGGIELKITDSIGCTATDSVWVKWDKQKDVVLSNDTLLFCSTKQDSVIANLVGQGSFNQYQWNILSGFADYSVKNDSILLIDSANNALIEIVAIDSKSCIFKDTVFIDSDLLNLTITKPQSYACVDQILDLEIDFDTKTLGKYEYLWEVNDLTFSSKKDTTYTFSDTSKLKITLSNTAYDCIISDSITVYPSLPLAVINQGKDTITACFGTNSIDLEAKSSLNGFTPYTYKWSSNASDISLNATDKDTTIVSTTASNHSSKIFLEITDSIACRATDSVTIVWQEEIKSPVEFNALACNSINDTIVSKAIGTNLSYAWSSSIAQLVGSTTNDSLIYNPNNSLNAIPFNLRITNLDGCSKDTAFVIAMQNLSVNIESPSLEVCSKSTLPLKAKTNGATSDLFYNWNGLNANLNDSTKNYQFTQDSTITVSIYDTTTNCSAKTEVNISISELKVSANIHSDSLCFGDSTTLKLSTSTGGSGNNSYSWSGGELSTEIVKDSVKVQPSSIGLENNTKYYLKAIDQLGCVAVDSVILSRNNEITSNLIASVRLCEDSTISVGTTNNTNGGTGNFDYFWSTNNGQITSTSDEIIDFTPLNSSSTLSLKSTDIALTKCNRTDFVSINLEFGPLLTLSSSFTNCSKDSLALDADTNNVVGVTHLWSTGAKTKTIKVLNAGNYSVVSTSAFGCKTIANTEFIRHSSEKVRLIMDTSSICAYNAKTFILEGAKNGTTTWSSISSKKDSLVNDSTFLVFSQDLIKDTIKVNIAFTGICLDTLISVVFKVNEVPNAQFSTSIPEIRQLQNFGFVNETTNATNLVFDWKVETDKTSILSNSLNGPELSITEIGNYKAQLIAKNSLTGCRDTTSKIIEILRAENIVYVPTAFYPNAANAENQVVKVYGNNISDKGFSFEIYNRWGELMYEAESASQAQTTGWNEYASSPDDKTNITVFTYILKGEFIDGTAIKQNGTITLIK